MPEDRGPGRAGKNRGSSGRPQGGSEGRGGSRGPSRDAGRPGRPGAKKSSGGRGPSGKGRPPSKDGRTGGARRSGPRRDTDSDGSSGERSPRGGPGERRPDRDLAGPQHWGRLARRGAGNINYEDPAEAEKRAKSKQEYLERRAARAAREAEEPAERPLPDPPERNLPNADDLERGAKGAVKRARKSPKKGRRPLPPRPHQVLDPAVALRKMVGEQRAKSLNRRLNDAGKAFGAERFDDARRSLEPIIKEAADLPEGRELMGLTFYRFGQWKEAARELEAFRELSGSTEQHPVLADCYRALGRWSDVDELWIELGETSPSAELVVEGRIVVAGSLADRGDLEGAIRVLELGWRPPKNPRDHHLRRAYALADLYDRVGRTPRARELFKWLSGHAPDMADVSVRLRALG